MLLSCGPSSRGTRLIATETAEVTIRLIRNVERSCLKLWPHTLARARARTHTHTHTHTHTNTHTRTHARTHKLSLSLSLTHTHTDTKQQQKKEKKKKPQYIDWRANLLCASKRGKSSYCHAPSPHCFSPPSVFFSFFPFFLTLLLISSVLLRCTQQQRNPHPTHRSR